MNPPAPSKNQPARATGVNKTKHLRQLLMVLLAAAAVLEIITFFEPLKTGGWPEAILIVLAALTTIVFLTRQLPLQNVLLAAVIVAVGGSAAHALDAKTGIPFGPLIFGQNFGQKIFKTLPWPIPLLWLVVVLNSRGVARLILRPWRKTKTYGFWLIGFTAGLTALFVFALEPFASRVKLYWLWTPTKFPVTWYGATPLDFLGWAGVTVLMLAFATPSLIRKQSGQKSGPDFSPLWLWLGAILIFAVACGVNGLWAATAVDAVIGIVAAIFAVRGARW